MKTAWNWIAFALTSSCMFGKLPAAGTWGSLVGLLIQVLMIYAGVGWFGAMVFVIISFILCLLVIPAGERVMYERWGPRQKWDPRTRKKITVTYDYNQDNIDEIHGQAIAGLPVFLWAQIAFTEQALWLLGSFVLFRALDIYKPPPIRQIESKFHGTAFGIVIDDTIAGIIAGAVLQLIRYSTIVDLLMQMWR